MKTLHALIITILVLSFSQSALARNPADKTYLALKKWGLTYCLTTYSQDNGMETEAERAMEWYRTRGPQDDKLFMTVQKYFDDELEDDHSAGKHGGNTNLMKCLNAYTRAEYDKVLQTHEGY